MLLQNGLRLSHWLGDLDDLLLGLQHRRWLLVGIHTRRLVDDGHIRQGALEQCLQDELRLMILWIIGIMSQDQSLALLGHGERETTSELWHQSRSRCRRSH